MIDILKTGNIRRLNKQSDKKKNNYYLNGAIYITKISDYLKKKELLTKKTGFFIMPENRSIDIDLKQDYLKAKKIIEKNEKNYSNDVKLRRFPYLKNIYK